MKLSTGIALLLVLVVLGLVLAFLVAGAVHELNGAPGYLLGAVLLLAAGMFDSPTVDSWIRAAIDHLPSFGKKSDGGAGG